MRIGLSEFSLPLHRAAVVHRLRPLGEQETEVSMEMDYDVKFGPMGWVMNSLMLQSMMGKMFAQVLGSLDHHVVTGELVGRDGERAISTAAA